MLHLNLGQDVDRVTGPPIHLWRGSAEVGHPAQPPLLDALTVVEIKGDLRFVDKFHSSEGFSCFYSTLIGNANMTDKAAAELPECCILVVMFLPDRLSPSLCYTWQQLQGILDSQGV